MSDHAPWTTRKTQAAAELERVLGEYADVFGPRECLIHSTEPCDCEPDSGRPVDSFLSEFVVVTAWTTIESGANLIDYYAREGSLLTHNLGLLRASQVLVEKDITG